VEVLSEVARWQAWIPDPFVDFFSRRSNDHSNCSTDDLLVPLLWWKS